MQSQDELLAAFKAAYDKKGKGALDYDKFSNLLSPLEAPQRIEALQYVTEADANALTTNFGATPLPSAPPARDGGRSRRRRGKKTKKVKGGRRSRKGSKTRRR